jgi:hypothetical protein
MVEPLSFSKAYEKWQSALGISEISILEQTVLFRKNDSLAKKHPSYDKLHQPLYTLHKWEEIKNDSTINDLVCQMTDVVKYRFRLSEFLDVLFIHQMPCLLRKDKYSYDQYPFLIFKTHRKEIIEDLGGINIDDKPREVCFDPDAFEIFLEKVREEYKVITMDSLLRGAHTPEGRVFLRALKELTDDQIKSLHKQGDDTNNNKTPLAEHLQEWEPTLKDRWAIHIAVLLSKFVNR